MTEAEFSQAFEQHNPKILRYLHCKRVPPAYVDDIAQAAWVHAWEKRDTIKNEGAFVWWLYRIVHNRYIDWGRRKTRFPSCELPHDLSCELWPVWMRVDLERILKRLLGETDCTIVLRHHRDGFSAKQIAQQFHISQGCVRIILYRARILLKPHLTARGYTSG